MPHPSGQTNPPEVGQAVADQKFCGYRWHNVYDQFRRWREDGTIECVHDTLREKARTLAGREPTPSAAIVDSQSVKTAEKGALAEAPTVANSSRAASATSPQTRRACCVQLR